MDMVPDKIIYTDGHDVTVTSSDLKVRNNMYKVNGIIKHGLLKLKANRLPGIILFLAGGVVLTLGLMDYFPASLNVRVGDTMVLSNLLATWLGALLIIAGTILIIAQRESYAVCISTAEGEKNVVVSKRREYVAQIVEALNEAYRQIDLHKVHRTIDAA